MPVQSRTTKNQKSKMKQKVRSHRTVLFSVDSLIERTKHLRVIFPEIIWLENKSFVSDLPTVRPATQTAPKTNEVKIDQAKVPVKKQEKEPSIPPPPPPPPPQVSQQGSKYTQLRSLLSNFELKLNVQIETNSDIKCLFRFRHIVHMRK